MNRAMIQTAMALFLLLASAPQSGAQSQSTSDLNRPILFEGNGNYYMLLNRSNPPFGELKPMSPQVTWAEARRLAERYTYEGVSGRLAKIDDAALESFTRTRFNEGELIWIGIAYDCTLQKMIYADGTMLSAASYTHWHPVNWGPRNSLNQPSCTGNGHMGTTMIHRLEGAPYWRLFSSGRRLRYLLVEFPTGEQAQETPPASNETEGR